MNIGVPKEIKQGEFRVALTPRGALALRTAGHEIFVERDAGAHAGFSDGEYKEAGARLVNAVRAWANDLIVKVKEPLPKEFRFFRPGQRLFTFLHLAPNRPLVSALLQKKVTAVGYETVQEENGALPILKPMSEVAGRVAALMGAYYQANPQGGRGVLFGGVSGVLPAHVVVLGGGTVGENAARVASGMGSRVTILESRETRLAQLKEIFPQASVLAATPEAIAAAVASADILVGGVHVPGSKTPRLVTRALVKKMKPRSVIVDVAIDQGGSCETSRPTTHAQPTFVAEKVLHYCVTNMPGAYGRTSTDALTNATLPFLQQLAQPALEQLPFTSPALARGVQCYAGRLLCKPVADIQRRPFISFEEALRHP